jgi:chemotaxis protein methyltransferase CheR
MHVPIEDRTFAELSAYIYERTGIRIPPTKKYLVENRLGRVLEEFNLKGFEEFLYRLRYSPPGSRELTRLVDAITTNETYFFREPHPLEVFIEGLVPRLLAARQATKDLNIWSAACSTGDEPYTISLLLRERRPNVRASIVGTDISSRVLESARRGVFTSYSVRNLPESYMKKYFRQDGQDFILDPSVRSSVSFRPLNLIDRIDMSRMRDFDVIFCRNVLIYFDDNSKQKAVSLLYDSLRPGGYLLIGSSESLHNVTKAFKPTTISRVVVYQKV